MTAGDRVRVCIRPEHLRLSEATEGFAGVVEMAMPLGATVIHEVRVAGTAVRISEPRSGETKLQQTGAPVQVALTAPGLWLQRVTTQQPSDEQAMVAIQALDGAMQLEEAQGGELVIA